MPPKSLAAISLLGVLGLSCPNDTGVSPPSDAVVTAVPDWAARAIWYQIFVERFRNGDPTNDPTPHDKEGSYPHKEYEGWTTTPWTHDWYEPDPWAGEDDFYRFSGARRYGGDLQGVLDRLDYLIDLGVTALYFNPINDAPTLHKYDPRNYHHVDRNFGPNPRGDERIMQAEDPADPATWQWTSADSLFLKLVEAVHARGIRIILDYSWNHTGNTFWAFRKALVDAESPYNNWYYITKHDDPATPENEGEWKGWFGVSDLPEIRKTGVPDDHSTYPIKPFEGDLQPDAKAHMFAVTRRWLDPNGDGDPSDGIDGFRLDVAGQVPLGFWRDYKELVRSINPQAYLVGEVWWEESPDKLADPNPWLGPVFDAVMNYRWYPPARSFLTGAPMFGGDRLNRPISASEFVLHLDSLALSVPVDNARVMMNTHATHDTPRAATSLYNRNLPYKFDAVPRGDSNYRFDKPDSLAYAHQRMLVTLQFALPGGPHIWYGDEVGMWGADDPDTRKPMVWADMAYDVEDDGPNGRSREPDPVSVDSSLLDFYKRLIAVRKDHEKVFVEGDLAWPVVDDTKAVLVMARRLASEAVLVVLNNGRAPAIVDIPAQGYSSFRRLIPEPADLDVEAGTLSLDIPPTTAVIVYGRSD